MARAKAKAARPATKQTSLKEKAGAKAPAFSVSSADAESQLDAFIERFTPEVAALGRKALAHMRKRLPGTVSLVYDNYNALAIGFGPAGRAAALSIALYPRWVNLFFLTGVALDDPRKLLKGSGSRVRSIRIDDAKQLKDPYVDGLITAAVIHAGWTLDPKAKNVLVIQSIAKTQRPRRV